MISLLNAIINNMGDDYDLAFVEYSERGNVFNRDHLNDVLRKLENHARDDGVITIVFVHGWTHNAKQSKEKDETDSNLRDFKEVLELLSKNNILFNRKLVGVYVGWRGASIEWPYLDLTTFWDRKSVATEVGKGGVTELLFELSRIDRIKSKNTHQLSNVFVTLGHSFGGAIVLSALAEALNDKIVSQQLEQPIQGIGNGIILLNPAIEANQALTLVESTLNRKFLNHQQPLLISISSDADRATHYAFPIGQSLGTLFTWRQTDLQRDYYIDRNTGQPIEMREEYLDSSTVGNFAPFLTHRLEMNTQPINCKQPYPTKQQLKDNFTFDVCGNIPDGCRDISPSRIPSYAAIKALPNNYPLYFIKTNGAFIQDHNDIFNPAVQGFLIALINDSVNRDSENTRRSSDGKGIYSSLRGYATPSVLTVSKRDQLGDDFARFTSLLLPKLCDNKNQEN